MEDLNEMLHRKTLAEIEEELSLQFSGLEQGYYDAKLAVMLYIMMQDCMEKFGAVVTDTFPAGLVDKFRDMKEEYSRKVIPYRSHLEENRKVLDAMETAGSGLSELEDRITSLLSEFDNLLRTEVKARETKSIAELQSGK